MNRLQSIFNPTAEEQIQLLEKVKGLHEENIGHCITCKHYEGSEMPGFVTDYGKCRKKGQMFSKKVCGLISDKCPMYEENTEKLMFINQEIQKLMEAIERDDADRKNNNDR